MKTFKTNGVSAFSMQNVLASPLRNLVLTNCEVFDRQVGYGDESDHVQYRREAGRTTKTNNGQKQSEVETRRNKI